MKTFRWSFIISALALVLAFIYGGWPAFLICLVLGILEVSISFDNAVLNATILRKMSPFWQKMFLTIGILIAVFGMRLVFPLLIVALAANIGLIETLQLALQRGDPHTPGTYGYIFASAHPVVAAFGGAFLLMLFLHFLTEKREVLWLRWIEKPAAIIGRIPFAPALLTIGSLLITTALVPAEEQQRVLIAGLIGVVLYFAIHTLGESLKKYSENKAAHMALATGKAGFVLFMYLEILDATLSFDGAIGAFAITPDPIIIALGLGLIGAMFVRSLTVYMVKRNTLESLVYLEHGAHWAIGALAIILLTSIAQPVSEFITGGVGVAFIGAAFIGSLRKNANDHKKQQAKK